VRLVFAFPYCPPTSIVHVGRTAKKSLLDGQSFESSIFESVHIFQMNDFSTSTYLSIFQLFSI
jgi:hypothetical protein